MYKKKSIPAPICSTFTCLPCPIAILIKKGAEVPLYYKNDFTWGSEACKINARPFVASLYLVNFALIITLKTSNVDYEHVVGDKIMNSWGSILNFF